ncbi:hypothetical protein DOT_0264 [Desulfosporosinus sp. OT]|nr:hypothetical protein DOT_0264 [Desulfosporosinus sp. OT]
MAVKTGIRFRKIPAQSELVQLKLNIEASDGDSTPPEVYEEPTPTYRSGGLEN